MLSTVSAKIATSNSAIAIYADAKCTQSLTSITWGPAPPGNSITQTIYVKNTGTTKLALTVSTANWNPSFANGPVSISLIGQNIVPQNQIVPITLRLNIASNATNISNFIFDIGITGVPLK